MPCIEKIGRVLKRSIQYGLEHREEALDYAMQFSRGLDRATASRFVDMYVNNHTLNVDAEVVKGVRLLLSKGHSLGIIAEKVDPEFIMVTEQVAIC